MPVASFARVIPTMYVLRTDRGTLLAITGGLAARQEQMCSPTSPTWLSNTSYFQDPKCWALQPPRLGPYVRGGGAVVG
jgi:hypothetical protein